MSHDYKSVTLIQHSIDMIELKIKSGSRSTSKLLTADEAQYLSNRLQSFAKSQQPSHGEVVIDPRTLPHG